MNREIQFRAWDRSRNKMRYGSDNLMLCLSGVMMWQFALDAPQPVDQEDFILMQFTGLKDKNGKEIYEGDILALGTYHCQVSWNKECASFCALYSNGECSDHLYAATEAEIIGNIYENPELLEK